MPIVTVDPTHYDRFELKSAPADPNDPNDEPGYVMLRPLPFGMKLSRSDKALRMSMQRGPQDRKSKGDEPRIDLETANEWTTHFDFAYCIGDHNLTDNRKVKVDFTKPMSVKLLDPKVGSEIESLIDKLNEDEDTESAEDLVRRSIGSYEVESTTLDTGGPTPAPQLVSSDT